MFQQSISELTPTQVETFAQLLVEFQDVFTTHDLDLGCFKGIQHHIDTADHPPIRQHLRHTPLGFEQEEERQLD